MNIIVLQHIKIEDPGYIKDLMLADGVKLTTIELDEGEKIPNNLNHFDGMFCMGGPMDTYMEKEYPWLIEEKKAIKEFVVNLKKPYLGFCLGCQLLGEVVGGKVLKSNPAEIGIMDVNFTNNKKQDYLFSKFPDKIKSLQWHSYEVQGIENNPDITLYRGQEYKFEVNSPDEGFYIRNNYDTGSLEFNPNKSYFPGELAVFDKQLWKCVNETSPLDGSSITIDSNKNASLIGPITIDSGVNITVNGNFTVI